MSESIKKDTDGLRTLPKMLSIQEAAQSLNVSTKSVRRLIARGKIKCFRVLRHVRIPETALHQLINENTY